MSPFERFLSAHPDYAATAALDELRRLEYGRLDAQQQVYLDYTGGGLHAASQVRDHAELLNAQVFGNPHSASPSSAEMTQLVESARAAVLAYFNAAGEYTAVFTLNASGAIKLVAEAYPFEPGSSLLMTADNHNSVNGMREFARAKGARVDYAPLTRPDLRIDGAAMAARLALAEPGHDQLLAFPAQSNFSGVKHPLALIGQAQAAGWHVLLDAAAFVPTNRLDLRAVQPDFVTISFYKMFGYPTGVGCLLVRNSALPKLRRPWFAGGTVNFATVQGRHARAVARARPASRTARSTTWASRRWRSACATSRRSASTGSRPACNASPAGCCRRCWRCAMAMAARWCACTGRPPRRSAAAP